MRLTTVTKRADLLLLTAGDFDDVPRSLGTVRLPPAFSPNRVEYRRDVARALNNTRLEPARGEIARAGRRAVRTRSSPTPSCASGCAPPGRPSGSSASWSSSRSRRRPRPIAGARVRPGARRPRSPRLRRRAGDWSLTARGTILSRLFHESDLLVAECLLAGLLDGLDAADLAGLLSVFVYEHRSPEPAPAPWFPSPDVPPAMAADHRLQRGPRRRRALDRPRRAPTARTPGSSARPTRGSPGRSWRRSSPTRTSPAATSCAR